MKSLIISFLSLFALNAFGEVLTPIDFEQEQVNVTTVEAVESFRSKDDNVSGRVTTVFRGSAMGFSSAFVTFADSLEDASYTFEFDFIIGQPTGLSIVKNNDNSYTFSMNVLRVVTKDDEFVYSNETIALKVINNEGEYKVESL